MKIKSGAPVLKRPGMSLCYVLLILGFFIFSGCALTPEDEAYLDWYYSQPRPQRESFQLPQAPKYEVPKPLYRQQCIMCSGRGFVKCWACKGTGAGYGGLDCNSCDGTGLQTCRWCNGKGYKEW